MRYAKINEAIWGDERFRTLSMRSKLMFLYLLSCSKCNSIGIYQIGLGQIEDEFGEERADIKEFLSDLEKIGLVRYERNWIWFNKYLKWNEPTSPNHSRKLASDVSDCVMRGAPVESITSFLNSSRVTLSNIWLQTAKEGKRRSYFDEFTSSLDVAVVGDYIGGSEALKKCLEGKYSPSAENNNGSTSNSIESTSENIDTKNKNNNKNNNNNNTRTKQDNTRLVCSCEKGESSEISLICSDGNSSAVSLSCVLLVRSKLSGLTEDAWRFAINRVQKDTLLHEEKRPDPSQVDDYFVKAMLPVGGLS